MKKGNLIQSPSISFTALNTPYLDQIRRPGKINHNDSHYAHDGKYGEGRLVALGGVVNDSCDGWAERCPGHGKQSRKSGNRRKGNKPEALTDNQGLHHDNGSHGQAECKGAQVQDDDMIVVGQGDHGEPLDQKADHDDMPFIAAVHDCAQKQTAGNTGSGGYADRGGSTADP